MTATTRRPPTPPQSAVLAWLADYWASCGYGPTVREVQTHFGWRSPNGAAYHLQRLRAAGLIEWQPKQPRGIRPTAEAASTTEATA